MNKKRKTRRKKKWFSMRYKSVFNVRLSRRMFDWLLKWFKCWIDLAQEEMVREQRTDERKRKCEWNVPSLGAFWRWKSPAFLNSLEEEWCSINSLWQGVFSFYFYLILFFFFFFFFFLDFLFFSTRWNLGNWNRENAIEKIGKNWRRKWSLSIDDDDVFPVNFAFQ